MFNVVLVGENPFVENYFDQSDAIQSVISYLKRNTELSAGDLMDAEDSLMDFGRFAFNDEEFMIVESSCPRGTRTAVLRGTNDDNDSVELKKAYDLGVDGYISALEDALQECGKSVTFVRNSNDIEDDDIEDDDE